MLKICGIRSADEARELRSTGVNYVGLNFIPHSTRFISLETAQVIRAEFQNTPIKIVGLFAGQPVELVNDYAARLQLDYVQLHGEEPAEYARQIKTPVMRAIPVHANSLANDIIEFIDTYPAEYFVLDRPVQGQGNPVDPELARQVIAARQGKVFLAGGLKPDNLANVLAHVRPFGIDIAGGVRNADNHLVIAKVEDCLAVLRDPSVSTD